MLGRAWAKKLCKVVRIWAKKLYKVVKIWAKKLGRVVMTLWATMVLRDWGNMLA